MSFINITDSTLYISYGEGQDPCRALCVNGQQTIQMAVTREHARHVMQSKYTELQSRYSCLDGITLGLVQDMIIYGNPYCEVFILNKSQDTYLSFRPDYRTHALTTTLDWTVLQEFMSTSAGYILSKPATMMRVAIPVAAVPPFGLYKLELTGLIVHDTEELDPNDPDNISIQPMMDFTVIPRESLIC